MSRIAPMRAPAKKVERQDDNPAYLAEVRKLPCCICEAFGEVQRSETQAHHPIHDRYSHERVPDREAIPLCEGHHQGLRDTTKTAIHRGKRSFRMKYGSDRQWIAQTQDKIDGLLGPRE